MKVTIIDYGLSNLLSVQHAFAHFGAETLLTSKPEDVLAADALVLPGVGAFQDGMAGLEKLGLVEPIRQKAAVGTPLLGICLGMQMLFDESEEFGLHKGLGLIPGRVVKIPDTDADGCPQRVPHTGTRCTPAAAAPILAARRWRRCSPARSATLSTATRPSPPTKRTAWPSRSTAVAASVPPPPTAASWAASSTRKNRGK